MAKIYLIGMPGSGKSTIGKALATGLNYTFIDLDVEIETNEGAAIEAIFEQKGEAYFRQIEAQVLSDVSDKKGDFVIATGGGTPCFYSGIKLMQETGITVFINVKPEVLIDRLKSDTQRPLLKDGVEATIEDLYKERVTIYSKAQISIKADELSKAELVSKINDKLNFI